MRLFTWWPMAMAMATVKLHVCVFFSIAIAITKWVHNPFTHDAIALAVGHQCERAFRDRFKGRRKVVVLSFVATPGNRNWTLRTCTFGNL